MIEAVPTITLNELNQALREAFPTKPNVCVSTISRALDAALITIKKCENVPHDRNSPAVKEVRVHFAHYLYEEELQKHAYTLTKPVLTYTQKGCMVEQQEVNVP